MHPKPQILDLRNFRTDKLREPGELEKQFEMVKMMARTQEYPAQIMDFYKKVNEWWESLDETEQSIELIRESVLASEGMKWHRLQQGLLWERYDTNRYRPPTPGSN